MEEVFFGMVFELPPKKEVSLPPFSQHFWIASSFLLAMTRSDGKSGVSRPAVPRPLYHKLLQSGVQNLL